MKLQRYEGNPILSPNPVNEWESLAVFNPAAWYDQDKKQVLLLSRAAESGPEYKCYFGLAGNLSHISVVVYALVATVGFLGYAFQGIGKFASIFFSWDLAWGPFSSADTYAITILGITTIYLLLGGWYSVVLTDLIQFVLLTVASVFIAGIAMARVSPDALSKVVPAGWNELLFGWKLKNE